MAGVLFAHEVQARPDDAATEHNLAPAASEAHGIAHRLSDIHISRSSYARGRVEQRDDMLQISPVRTEAVGLFCRMPEYKVVWITEADDSCTPDVDASLTVVADRTEIRADLHSRRAAPPTPLGEPARSPQPRLSEYDPARLGYLNYGLNLVRDPYGSYDGTLLLRSGLRWNKHALDLSGIYGHDSGFEPTEIAYSRNWFDQRVRLTAGRLTVPLRGLIGGVSMDGVGIARFNANDQGNAVLGAGARPVTGYLPAAGVLSYTVGETVYAQLPLEAGPFSISPGFTSGAPAGGRLQVVMVDGQTLDLNLPNASSQPLNLFQAGGWDFDAMLGVMRTPQSHRQPVLAMGGRYGMTDYTSIDASVIAYSGHWLLGASLDTLLPGQLGSLRMTGAYQQAGAVRAGARGGYRLHYSKDFGSVSLRLDHQRQWRGGASAHALTAGCASQRCSDANTSTTTVAMSTPIEALNLSLSIRGSTTRREDRERETAFETSLQGSAGRLGYWSLFGRFSIGRDHRRQQSINLSWTVPLGDRGGAATLSYANQRKGGRRVGEDDYRLTWSGNVDGDWGSGNNYSLSMERDGDVTTRYQHRFRALDVALTMQRQRGQRLAGNVSAQGGLVVADGHLIASRTVEDTVVVLRAPELAGKEVFVGTTHKPVNRLNDDGYAVVPTLREYMENRVRIDDSQLDLNKEIPLNVMARAVHPYRGYVVDVQVTTRMPARLYFNIPIEARGRAYVSIGSEELPIEGDGSVFVDDLGKIEAAVVTVHWRHGQQETRCTANARKILDSASENGDQIKSIHDIPCEQGEH